MKARNAIPTFVFLIGSGISHAAESSAVPEQLRAPADEALLLEASGKGVQIYECAAGTDQPANLAWKLKAPEAELFDTKGKKIGKHYAGPTWELDDGSRVAGTLKSKNDSPDPHAIPWLLLTAKSTSTAGMLIGAKSVQRLNTSGGKAPDKPCAQSNVGEQTRVPYSAEYYFYGAKR